MKEVIVAVSVFVISYGSGVFAYYSGHPQIGEGIAMLSCMGLILWGFSFAAVHSPFEETH